MKVLSIALHLFAERNDKDAKQYVIARQVLIVVIVVRTNV